jgi:hypothetical protein
VSAVRTYEVQRCPECFDTKAAEVEPDDNRKITKTLKRCDNNSAEDQLGQANGSFHGPPRLMDSLKGANAEDERMVRCQNLKGGRAAKRAIAPASWRRPQRITRLRSTKDNLYIEDIIMSSHYYAINQEPSSGAIVCPD